MRRLPVRPLPAPLPDGPEPAPPDGAAGRPGAAVVPAPAAEAGTAASPQASQYPPSMVPPQPGRVHVVAVDGHDRSLRPPNSRTACW